MTIQKVEHVRDPDAAGTVGIWWNRRFRSSIQQAILILCLGAIMWFFASNAAVNIDRQKLNFGFDFLSREAGFGIGETLLAYSSQDSFAWAFVAGLANTVAVSICALVLTTLLGFAVGIGSLSMNTALRRVCLTYVAMFRNVPLLLQLYLWYSIATGLLPAPTEAWNFLGIYVSRVGVYLPVISFAPTSSSVFTSLSVAVAFGLAVWNFGLGRRRSFIAVLTATVMGAIAGMVVMLVAGGGAIDVPVWQKFRFNGGMKFSPEFCALLLGLSVYTASFVAEIVRAGIVAVKKGQKEAAQALGLTPGQTMRHVVIPQAARVIIPPLTSQYLNLVKNSSLGVAIGYPDFVSIGNTTLNITGRAIECVAIMMAVYLALSLTISAFMNVYNKKMALRTR
ncbi:amino acid ABC transporter permease [Rhizobium giardinii]|uniref:amino acid ABC transporter permease n=1 Tax=Rhizobium giardinii TaxID=56731 RepID=UPI0013AF04BF